MDENGQPWTFEELAQKVCRERAFTTKLGETTVFGSFDTTTRILVWTADFAIRDEAYIRKLLEMQ